MSKSRFCDFIGLYTAIFKDISANYPTLRRGLERDLSRLMSLYENCGEAVFLLHLPAVGKHFDACLAAGKLTRTGTPLTRSVNTRTMIPRLFQGLWSAVFSDDGCLKQDIDPNLILHLRTIFMAAGKFRKDAPLSAKFTVVKEFYDVDNSLPPPSPIWDGDGSDLGDAELGSLSDLCAAEQDSGDLFFNESPDDCKLLKLCQQVADRVAVLVGDYVPSEYRFRHGPGAISEAQRGRSYKYRFSSWSPRLQHVFPGEVFAIANTSVLGADFDIADLFPVRETHSRVIAVPKTQKGPRLIAAEPGCHQWTQQNIRDFLDVRIRSTELGDSIDFRRQDLSREAARAASHSGSHATIDLSSASDRLSCYVIQRMFRKNHPVLAAMIASRTRYVLNELDKKQPKLHKLRKFSSMGSALTFPVQSLAFLIICTAAGLSLGGSGIKWQNYARQVRVYGDDLIVPVAWVPRVKYLLERCFLKVNQTKTFYTGRFRESCGMDAFEGYDVTPPRFLQFHSRAKLASIISVTQVSNNFYIKGYWHTADWIMRTVPESVRKYIPVVALKGETFGAVSLCGSQPTTRLRWNADLHREEQLAFMPSGKKAKLRDESFQNLLQYFTEDPAPTELGMYSLTSYESGMFGSVLPGIRKGWVPTQGCVGDRKSVV